MKTNKESIEKYHKELTSILKYPMLWEAYAEHMDYCNKYEKLNEDIHDVNDIFNRAWRVHLSQLGEEIMIIAIS